MKRNVYVVGHRNPDSDSICSAIAYAELKNQISEDYTYTAARAGQLNDETLYVLKRLGVEVPVYLNNIGTRVKDMEIRKTPGIVRHLSLKRAYEIMEEENVVTLPITDADGMLDGVITINDVATSYMKEQTNTILAESKTPYANILDTLDAQMLVGDPQAFFEEGKVLIAAANPDIMEKYIEPHDMVIMGNRYESQFSAIESGAGCIIVCLGMDVPKSIQRLAGERNCTIIVTPLGTYDVARLIGQSMPVSYFMTSKDLVTFNRGDYVDKISETMKKLRIRDFPVLDQDGHYNGMISRRNLLNVRKRAVILVDHNEIAQSLENIQNAEILEIIDHHRLGSLQTMDPVFFRNEPVGSTATIVATMYFEKGVMPSKQAAGLMMAAILSDTLMFRSPTATLRDRDMVYRLAEIAELDPESFADDMFKAGSELSHKTAEEIFYQDYKKFEFGEYVFGVSQISSMSGSELEAVKESLQHHMERVCQEQDVKMMFCMLTDIKKECTTLLCSGPDAVKLAQEAFGKAPENGCFTLEKVVSRKKQLIPAFLQVINGE